MGRQGKEGWEGGGGRTEVVVNLADVGRMALGPERHLDEVRRVGLRLLRAMSVTMMDQRRWEWWR